MSRHSCTCSKFIMVRVEWHYRARWVVVVSQDGPWVGLVFARRKSFEQKNHVIQSEEFHLVRVLSKGPKVCANHHVTDILSCLNDWRSHHVDCTQVKSIIDSDNTDLTTPEYLWTSWRPTKWKQCLIHPVHLIQHARISIDLDLLRNTWRALISKTKPGLSKHLASFGWDWKLAYKLYFSSGSNTWGKISIPIDIASTNRTHKIWCHNPSLHIRDKFMGEWINL
jgi:hypothetical protein